MSRVSPLTVFAALYLAWPAFVVPAVSRAAEDADEETWLEEVVVVATRTPRALDTVPGQVGVINAEALDRNLATDIDRALAFEPGVNVQNDGSRFGASGVNLRGIGGNRVRIDIDGVPVRDGFSIGAFANAGRLLVETERVQRIELLYGPASVLYGSNALGGVMSITTWDPLAYLEHHGTDRQLETAAGVTGANDGLEGSALYARAVGDHGLLAAYTARSGHELQSAAIAGTSVDRQDWSSHDAFARYAVRTASGNRLRISVGSTRRQTDSDIRSLPGHGVRYRWTTSLKGDDRDRGRRLIADWSFESGGWRQGVIRAYRSSYDTSQVTNEVRGRAPRPTAIRREFRYGEDITGAEAQVFRTFDAGAVAHHVGIGGQWTRSDVDELRDGVQTDLLDGSESNVILGESMPVRDFPRSRGRELGAWLQDEIGPADGRWSLIPALRWDHYRLEPRPDAIWREDNPATPVVSITTSRVTPRLGATFSLYGAWSLFGQYATGFRSPPFEDANIGFDIPLFGFRAIPNPDLRPETSRSLEAGVRRLSAGSSLAVSVFHSDYEDFIESRAPVGIDPATGDLLFQSRNIGRAVIRGVDLRYEQDLSAWSPRLNGWLARFSAFWAESEDRQSGRPLNGIAPGQAVLQLGWIRPDGAWEVLLSSTWTAAKRRTDIDDSVQARFATPSWSTHDITVGWRPLRGLEVRAGVFNLLDETYWRWLDVSNLDAGNPMIPALSRPGRNYSLRLRAFF